MLYLQSFNYLMKDHPHSIFLVIFFISIQFCSCRQYIRTEDNCSVPIPTAPIGEESSVEEIKFPFRLSNQPESCGYPGFDLYYNGSYIMIKLPSTLLPLAVCHIDYTNQLLYAYDPDVCLFTRLLHLNLSGSPFQHLASPNNPPDYPSYESSYYRSFECAPYYPSYDSPYYKPFNCPPGYPSYRSSYYKPFKCSSSPSGSYKSSFNAIPARCISDHSTGQYYLVDDVVPSSELSLFSCDPQTDGKFLLDFCLQRIQLAWEEPDCTNCYGICSLNRTTNGTACRSYPDSPFDGPQYYYGSDHKGSYAKKVATGLCLSIVIAVIAGVIFLLIRKMHTERKKRQNMKIEEFLREFKSMKPTRYSYPELKKMTDNFKTKLGQGGYGTVFKGKLPSGVPMAVKVLENPTLSGEEFTNEIGTIGRIHHVHIVRLFGFCVEGSTRALIYEFMPNDSLDKRSTVFSWTKLLEISMGIARGIEYLHQGCDQRILHLDIKPHNILLDREFNPKISDFGLSKLCSKEKSVVSMTAVRGTVGYIAPEVFLGSNKKVSHKSDVYSFGMLLLEMVGGRMTKIDSNDQDDEAAGQMIYFPEWIHTQLKQGELSGLRDDQSREDAEIMKKLSIIALWCAQWRPADRPSMKEIVQMLEGSLESLALPPNPFVSRAGARNMDCEANEEDLL